MGVLKFLAYESHHFTSSYLFHMHLNEKVSNYKIVTLMRFFQCHVLQLYERSLDPFYLGFSGWNQTINFSFCPSFDYNS